jgi:tryptophan halogenase
VVAVGLAGGFLEPLESTSIHLVQAAIDAASPSSPTAASRPPTSKSSTRRWTSSSTRIRDFIILHYKLTQRDDSPFWRRCRDMPVPESLSRRMALYKIYARSVTGRMKHHVRQLALGAGVG